MRPLGARILVVLEVLPIGDLAASLPGAVLQGQIEIVVEARLQAGAGRRRARDGEDRQGPSGDGQLPEQGAALQPVRLGARREDVHGGERADLRHDDDEQAEDERARSFGILRVEEAEGRPGEQQHLPAEMEHRQGRVAQVEQPRPGEGQGEAGRERRRAEDGAARGALRRGWRVGRGALRAVPDGQRRRGGRPFEQHPALEARQQEGDELLVTAELQRPALLLALRRLDRQPPEAQREILRVLPFVRPDAGRRSLSPDVQEHLDEARLGEDEQHLVIEVAQMAQADRLEAGRDLHRLRAVEDVLVPPQQAGEEPLDGLPLLAPRLLLPAAQEGRGPGEDVVGGRTLGALGERPLREGTEELRFDLPHLSARALHPHPHRPPAATWRDGPRDAAEKVVDRSRRLTPPQPSGAGSAGGEARRRFCDRERRRMAVVYSPRTTLTNPHEPPRPPRLRGDGGTRHAQDPG